MKHLKKIMAVVTSIVMVLAMGMTAFADDPVEPGTPSITIKPNNDTDVTTSTTITYTYYKILTADIDTDATVSLDGTIPTGSEGTVAYYVTAEAQATALAGTGVFTVTRVGTTDKWYVELAAGKDVDDIITAFNNETFLANFTEQTYTSNGGDAVLPGVSAGYYFIKSSLGSKIAVQTLSPVTINEKNEYVTSEKTVPEVDENSQIGQEITYTLKVEVPVTATEEIVLTDTMSKGLTFKEVKSQKIGTTDATDAQKGTVSAVTAADAGATKFTITYTADQVKALVADGAAKTINVEVTVFVNEEAVVDTNIENKLDMKYGNNYNAVPSTVNTKTTKFEFDKVDGTDSTTKLTGAEFQLTLDGETPIPLVKVEEGKTYRVATAAEITAAGETLVNTIVTNGNTVTINGLDGDVTYKLVETKAPTSYNRLTDPIDVEPNENNLFVHQNVENNKGATLPSTGGMGTTIFYIVGAVLVLGAGILLVARKRMSE